MCRQMSLTLDNAVERGPVLRVYGREVEYKQVFYIDLEFFAIYLEHSQKYIEIEYQDRNFSNVLPSLCMNPESTDISVCLISGVTTS